MVSYHNEGRGGPGDPWNLPCMPREGNAAFVERTGPFGKEGSRTNNPVAPGEVLVLRKGFCVVFPPAPFPAPSTHPKCPFGLRPICWGIPLKRLHEARRSEGLGLPFSANPAKYPFWFFSLPFRHYRLQPAVPFPLPQICCLEFPK
jgi:hypothetical protein